MCVCVCMCIERHVKSGMAIVTTATTTIIEFAFFPLFSSPILSLVLSRFFSLFVCVCFFILFLHVSFSFHLIFFRTFPVCSEDDKWGGEGDTYTYIQITGQYYYHDQKKEKERERERKGSMETNHIHTHTCTHPLSTHHRRKLQSGKRSHSSRMFLFIGNKPKERKKKKTKESDEERKKMKNRLSNNLFICSWKNPFDWS